MEGARHLLKFFSASRDNNAGPVNRVNSDLKLRHHVASNFFLRPFTYPSGVEVCRDWLATHEVRILANLELASRAPAEHWIWDGVHPTYSGHQIMADEWERTVREFWTKRP